MQTSRARDAYPVPAAPASPSAPRDAVPRDAAASPRDAARDAASFLVSLERAELAGAACTLGDVVRELRRAGPDAGPGTGTGTGPDVVALLDAYHRHLCSAYRACPIDGQAPVLAFSSFARTSRRAAR